MDELDFHMTRASTYVIDIQIGGGLWIKTISGKWYSWGSSFFADPPEPSKRRPIEAQRISLPIKAQRISLISIVRVEKTSHLNVFGHRIPDIGLTNSFGLIGYTHSVFADSWNNARFRAYYHDLREIYPREWLTGSLVAWHSWDRHSITIWSGPRTSC